MTVYPKKLTLIAMGLLLTFLVACGSTGEPAADQTPVSTTIPTEVPQESPADPAGEVIANEAVVESMQILILESMPVQVMVEITGYLPDGCTTIAKISSMQAGNQFDITITTQRDQDAVCTTALVPFKERLALDVFGLPAGNYTASVTGRDVTLTESFNLAMDNVPVEEPPPATAAPSAGELPASCFPQAAEDATNGPFINLQDGYCFQYPIAEGFRVHDVRSPGIAAVWGPPLTPTFEPIRAGLTVYKTEPAAGRTLDEVVAAILQAHPEAYLADAAATFAGEPAQVVEGISGMMDSRVHYLLHNGFVYEITLVPLTQPGEYEEAVMAQRTLLWDTVSATFTWLPPETMAQFESCPQMDPAGPIPKSPYVNGPHGYCLLYPSHYGQSDSFAQDLLILTGPALNPTVPEPLRILVTVSVTEAAVGRSVQQVVDEIVAEYPDLAIEQSETELAGEAAIIVTGLPGRDAGRDLFVVHNDLVYRIRLEPLGFPELGDGLEDDWDTITGSFHFWR